MRASKLHYAEAFCLTFLILAGHFFSTVAWSASLWYRHCQQPYRWVDSFHWYALTNSTRGLLFHYGHSFKALVFFFWCIKLWGKLGWSSLHHVQVVAVLWKMDSGFESELWTRSWTFCRTKRKDVLPKQSKNRGSGEGHFFDNGTEIVIEV